MAKLDTDFSAYTGAHTFYVFVPYISNTSAQGKKSPSTGEKHNLKMGLRHVFHNYVIKSTDRAIGYIDDTDNMCYILSNKNNDIGYNGATTYIIGTANYDNTELEYKAQTALEQNIASSYIDYTSGQVPGSGYTYDKVPCTDLNLLTYDEPTFTYFNTNTDYIHYDTKYPNGKLGWNTNQLLYGTKEDTGLVVHVSDEGMYGTAPVQGLGTNGFETHVSVLTGDSMAKWVENTALANNTLLNNVEPNSNVSYGNNLTELASMPDSNAVIYNLITTHDYAAALKFLADGTVPDDAKVNEKKDSTDADDENESGENGAKQSTFDENEPSAPTINSVKLSNLHNYWITESQMKLFYDAVWNTDLTDFVKGAFTGIYSNLISNVISLKYMPTSPTNLGGTGDTSPVILGFKTYEELTVQTIGNAVAPIVDIGSYQFKREYNSFADYAPYTDIRLYLPFVGVVPLDTNLFMGAGGDTPPKLNVKAQYDLQSGLITYFIMRNKTMISSVSGRMAVEVPISLQSGMDTFTTISSNFIGKATSFAGNAMAGNPIGMVADIAQGSATAPPQTVFSSMGGDGAFYAHPKCMIMIRHPQYNRPKNYSHVVGFPAYVTKKVSDLNGFNTIKNPVVPLAEGMTSVERDMIVADMQKGLYY